MDDDLSLWILIWILTHRPPPPPPNGDPWRTVLIPVAILTLASQLGGEAGKEIEQVVVRVLAQRVGQLTETGKSH